jgi:HEAT repeat protein
MVSCGLALAALLTARTPTLGAVGLALGALAIGIGLVALTVNVRFHGAGTDVAFAGAVAGSLAFLLAGVITWANGGLMAVIRAELRERRETNQTCVPIGPWSTGSAADASAEHAGWADANKEAAQQGMVRVQVTGLWLEEDASEGSPRGTSPLQVRVRIENAGRRGVVTFEGWKPAGPTTPRLTDNFGKAYRSVAPGQRDTRASRPESIPPSKTATDLLAFERPGDRVRFLRLELPAAAFGGQGSLGLEIPNVMIVCQLSRALGSAAVPGFRLALADADPLVRMQAAAGVGAWGPRAKSLVPDLAMGLTDSEPLVRRAAAQALGDIGPPAHKALPALIQALGDAAAPVHQAAAAALQRLGPPARSDLPTLTAAVSSPSRAVRLYAVDVLAGLNLEPPAAIPLFTSVLGDPASDIRIIAAQALAKVGPEGRTTLFPVLLQAMRAAEPEVRPVLIQSLRSLEPLTAVEIPGLQAALDDDAVEVRRYAADTLRQLAAVAAGAADALAARLADDDEHVRTTCAATLRQLGPAALPALQKALKDHSDSARRLSALTLGDLGADSQPVLPQLIEAVADRVPRVRAAAVRALGLLGAAAKVALPTLVPALKDPDLEVRRQAVQAMAKVGPAAFTAPALIEAFGDVDDDVSAAAGALLPALYPLPDVSVPSLRKALLSPRPNVRAYALATLGEMGSSVPDLVPELKSALKDRDATVRLQAVRALVRLGGEAGTLPALLQALQGTDADVARVATQGIDHVGRLAASDVPALVHALQHGKPSVRMLAASYLKSLGPEARDAVPALGNALRDPDELVRGQAASALGAVGQRAWPAVPQLGAALRDKDVQVRRKAAEALGQLGPEARKALPALIRALLDRPIHDEASRSLVHLGRIAVPDLIEAAQDKGEYQLRLEALAVLGAIGPEAQEALVPLSSLAVLHPSANLRRGAREALHKIQRK